jgi:hypothetical protein
MASRQVPNIYGAATPLGEGLANVFGAFMSAPTEQDRATAALKIHGLQAGAQRDLAAAGYDTSRTRGQDISNEALQALPTLDLTSPTAQGRVMQTMGGNYSSLPDVFATHLALQPGTTLKQMDPIVYAKTGNAGNTMQGVELADTTTRRGQDVTAATGRYGHDRDYAASVYNTDQTQAGNDRRFSVETSPGAITTLAPGNPLGQTQIVGLPTTDTQKGLIIADERARPGFDPVGTQYDAQSAVGGALGVPNEPKEGSGMSLTVGPDGTVQMTQGSAGVGLPTSTISNNLQAQDSIESYLRTSKELRDLASQDPLLFGTPGNVQRFLQSTAAQVNGLLQLTGKADPNAAQDVNSVFETVLTDLSMNGVKDPALYNPNLTDIDKLAILAAYQAASAIAGQEGRGLSNEDFMKFRTIVGDPTAWGSTQGSFMAGLNRLDRLAMAELNARRQKLGMDPYDPNAQPAPQSQGEQRKSLGGKEYVKVGNDWFEVVP